VFQWSILRLRVIWFFIEAFFTFFGYFSVVPVVSGYVFALIEFLIDCYLLDCNFLPFKIVSCFLCGAHIYSFIFSADVSLLWVSLVDEDMRILYVLKQQVAYMPVFFSGQEHIASLAVVLILQSPWPQCPYIESHRVPYIVIGQWYFLLLVSHDFGSWSGDPNRVRFSNCRSLSLNLLHFFFLLACELFVVLFFLLFYFPFCVACCVAW